MTLTKSDRAKLIQELEEKLVTKEEFAQALAENNNYLTSILPTKEAAMADKLEILGAISKLQEDDSAHKQLHHDLGQDVPKLQHQIKHIANTMQVDMPVNLAFWF